MNLFQEIVRCLEAGEKIALVTVVRAEGSSPRKTGSRMLVREDGSIYGTIGGGTVEHRVIERALLAIQGGEPDLYRVHLTRDLGMCCGGAMEFHIEPLQQDPTLVIFGAGHVGKELCPMAAAMGFQVIVVDDREEFATRERFPTAHEVLAEDPLAALDELPFGPNSYFIIVTHSHRTDEELLRALAARDYRYLGMIGSRAKVARFVERLKARGVPEEALARAHMPIGLAIGATTPAEIAVSIAAELTLVRRAAQVDPRVAPSMNWRPGLPSPDFRPPEEVP